MLGYSRCCSAFLQTGENRAAFAVKARLVIPHLLDYPSGHLGKVHCRIGVKPSCQKQHSPRGYGTFRYAKPTRAWAILLAACRVPQWRR